MDYSKYLLPLGIVFLLTVLSAAIPPEYRDIQLVIGGIVKYGALVYYLRLNNAKSPFVNTLTIILAVMMTGEYLFNTGMTTTGQVVFIIANIGFAIMFFLRQMVKDSKDKLMSLKVLAVCVYCIGNVLYIKDVSGLMPLLIGNLLLTGVYFYDTLLTISEQKNYRQQKL